MHQLVKTFSTSDQPTFQASHTPLKDSSKSQCMLTKESLIQIFDIIHIFEIHLRHHFWHPYFRHHPYFWHPFPASIFLTSRFPASSIFTHGRERSLFQAIQTNQIMRNVCDEMMMKLKSYPSNLYQLVRVCDTSIRLVSLHYKYGQPCTCWKIKSKYMFCSSK